MIRTIVIALALAFITLSCSSSSSSSGGTTTIEGLPKATGAVTTSSIRKGFDLQTAASTGVLMTAWDDQTWNTTKSGAACETGQMIIRLLSEAAQPDKIMCYVGAMEKLGAFTGSYDGTNKFYTLTGAGGGEEGRPDSTMRIKFNMVKTGDVISSFKMWMCQGSTQSEYVSEVLSGTSATVTSVGVHSGSFGSGSQRTTTEGTVTSAGAWTAKTITHDGSFGGGTAPNAFSHSQHLSLTQGSDSYTLSGYMSGYYGTTSNTNSGTMYAIMQGLNLGTLATAALGSGTANFAFTYQGARGERATHTATKSWNGDTMVPENQSTASYYTEVAAATKPTIASITAPSFSGAEVWDCNADSGQTSTALNMESISGLAPEMTSCNSKFGFSNNNFTNCRSASFD